MKTWFYIYRFDGKRRFLNLGHYALLSRAGARKKHREAWECKLLAIISGADMQKKVVSIRAASKVT